MTKYFKHSLIAIVVLYSLINGKPYSVACSENYAEDAVSLPLKKRAGQLPGETDFQEKDSLMIVPFELLVFIASFIGNQKDLIRWGLSSTDLRKACHETWKTRCLDLSRRAIKKEDLQCVISGGYPDVSLEGSTIHCENITDFLLNPNLIKLNVSNCKFSIPHLPDKLRFGDEEAKILAENKFIKILCFSWCMVTDVGAKNLAVNATIEDLDLYHNTIGVEGAEALLSNKTLKALDLRRNSLQEGELEKLSTHPTNITKLQLKYFSG